MRIPLYLFILVSLLILPFRADAGEIIDRVVAVVNDDIIALSELNEEGAAMYRRIHQEVPADQAEDAVKEVQKQILSELIDQLLISQRAAQRGINVDDTEIDAAVDRILSRNDTSVEQFREELEKMGSNEKSYRNKLRNQILRSKLISYEIRSKIVITDRQIQEFYQRQLSDIKTDEGYHLLQFGCNWGEDSRSGSPEEAHMRAIQLRDMVLAGSNFNDLAKEYSDLPSSADGGDIGVFAKDELADYMWEAIQGLNPGDISNIIRTPSGYQFFKLISSKQGNIVTQAPLASVKDEIRTQLYDQELEEKFNNWVKQLRQHSYVEELL
ncbi:MAG: SurA N-terminal domain-containing protein [Desulfobulbaceae bacterium]|uniref:SurA N-terminal domain-containing protein n=1 Tax=Candidatus Desulfobia pelagia TaxID=2841692 RepID=A0A8J6TCT6_9BACT|nr:SurA N-terminal domain-containing protein [Candidatus Desulfobia pelagia]